MVRVVRQFVWELLITQGSVLLIDGLVGLLGRGGGPALALRLVIAKRTKPCPRPSEVLVPHQMEHQPSWFPLASEFLPCR